MKKLVKRVTYFIASCIACILLCLYFLLGWMMLASEASYQAITRDKTKKLWKDATWNWYDQNLL